MDHLGIYDLRDLSDEDFASASRLHNVIHPSGPAGLYETNRNPSGCDRFWCLRHVPELIHGAEQRIRADERRRNTHA